MIVNRSESKRAHSKRVNIDKPHVARGRKNKEKNKDREREREKD